MEGKPIKEFDEPPLKKFVTAPRLKEDLAKCAHQSPCLLCHRAIDAAASL